jgi:hypothetical protein
MVTGDVVNMFRSSPTPDCIAVSAQDLAIVWDEDERIIPPARLAPRGNGGIRLTPPARLG